jgi:L-galactose dehydrogenase
VLRCCAAAAERCATRGVALEQLAVRFSVAYPGAATTFVGMPDEEQARRNVAWALGPLDEDLLAEVERVLAPVRDHTWPSGRPENSGPS